jgi:hypothetical protein
MSPAGLPQEIFKVRLRVCLAGAGAHAAHVYEAFRKGENGDRSQDRQKDSHFAVTAKWLSAFSLAFIPGLYSMPEV